MYNSVQDYKSYQSFLPLKIVNMNYTKKVPPSQLVEMKKILCKWGLLIISCIWRNKRTVLKGLLKDMPDFKQFLLHQQWTNVMLHCSNQFKICQTTLAGPLSRYLLQLPVKFHFINTQYTKMKDMYCGKRDQNVLLSKASFMLINSNTG